MELDKEIKVFTDELFRYGVRILICGGGVSFHPGEALGVLSMKYKREKLLQLAKQVAFETSPKYPEGTMEVARGIIYHLADKELLNELITMHRQGIADMEDLIAGICGRLKMAYPEGVKALDSQMEAYLFWG